MAVDLKAKLVGLLQYVHAEEGAFVAGLTEVERSAHGRSDCWAAKDSIAHLAEWKARMVDRLTAAATGGTPPTYDNIDQTNAEIFEKYHELSWGEVIAASERAHASLLESMQALTEADLVDAQRSPWLGGQPLWRGIAGNGCSHPVGHLAQLYVERGDRDRGARLQETSAAMLTELDESPAWQGVISYNLACYHAIAGEKDKAIARLKQALGSNPDLLEWSKQDTDFASIRQDPEFRAVCSG
jgi:tetratricopeptide (TPR) repeat protein